MLITTLELGTALWVAAALAGVGADLIALEDEHGGGRALQEAIDVVGGVQFVIRSLLTRARCSHEPTCGSGRATSRPRSTWPVRRPRLERSTSSSRSMAAGRKARL
jgi:hypothetical protein